MNPTERLNTWQGIAGRIRSRIQIDRKRLIAADRDVAQRIQADDQMRLRQAEGFVAMYEAKLAQQAS